MKVKITDIIVNERIRENAGDLASLMESMMNYGLLNPITLNRDYELLAGFRRLQAAKNLGWTEIDCNMVSAQSDLQKLLIETEENTTRLDFTPEEIVKIKEKREYLEAAGLKKFFMWLRKLWQRILDFFNDLFQK